MIRKIATLAFAIILSSCYIQAQEYIEPVEQWESEEIEGSNYHGYAFSKDWEVDFKIESQDGRYSLTQEDIAKAERLIQKRIAYVNRFHENQEGRCPIIDEHMNRYERQYVGFTDMNGYHIAWVNFLWDETIKDRLGKDILLTTGGCGHYWHIKVNLDTEKVYGLEVNEPGDIKFIPRAKKRGPRISGPQKPKDKVKIRKTGIIHSEEEKVF